MLIGKKKIMRHFSAVFPMAFLFLSTFANCLHTHHHEECAPVKSYCSMEKQVEEIAAVSGEHKDSDGDCAACSYLLSAQGAYFDTVNLPEKQVSDQYSVDEPKFLHNNLFTENLARAPPYFTA